jgi:hypothetical protein
LELRLPCQGAWHGNRRGREPAHRDRDRAADRAALKDADALTRAIIRSPSDAWLLHGYSCGRALASPGTAYIHDWNMLPLGQALWLNELESYKEFPPLQAPEAYSSMASLRK